MRIQARPGTTCKKNARKLRGLFAATLYERNGEPFLRNCADKIDTPAHKRIMPVDLRVSALKFRGPIFGRDGQTAANPPEASRG